VAAATAPGSPAVPSQDGLTLGRRQLQGGDARTAEATLTTWLASAPGDPKAGEGAYLRGRARSQQSAWADAAADYITALKGWPATWWAPDAVVELARALGRLGKTAESCQALETLTARYPAASEGARTRAAAVSAQSRCGT
jgi:TolA-binding protein